jgi:hypothetical protein
LHASDGVYAYALNASVYVCNRDSSPSSDLLLFRVCVWMSPRIYLYAIMAPCVVCARVPMSVFPLIHSSLSLSLCLQSSLFSLTHSLSLSLPGPLNLAKTHPHHHDTCQPHAADVMSIAYTRCCTTSTATKKYVAINHCDGMHIYCSNATTVLHEWSSCTTS